MNDLSKPIEMIKLPVSEKGNGIRLDKFLSNKVKWISREKLKSRILNGTIILNNEKVQPKKKLKTGDIIKIKVLEPMTNFIDPASVKVNIIYEDENILVVNKDPGIMVHPAGKTLYGTLINGIHYYFNNKNEIAEPRLLHRLDKNTSGVILISKNIKAHKIIVKTFLKREIKKVYHAVCSGIPKKDKGVIYAPIGKAINSHIKIKMQVDHENGKDALTRYKLLKKNNRFSLIKAMPETGRQHQIRLHLSYIGIPIVNDIMYEAEIGSDKELLWDKNSRFYLHAYSLEILNCKLFKEKSKIFIAQYSDDFKEFVNNNF